MDRAEEWVQGSEDVSHTVELRSLANMVRWLSAHNDLLFEKEFMDVEEDMELPVQEGLKPLNRAKNRYNQVISYDHSRVKLESTGEDGSDYINASWIGGESGRKMYIAAQAPLESTVCDMWRMVWEYRVEVIIMTTALTEDGKEKCVQYWPGSVGDVLCVDSSRLGAELRVTLNTQQQEEEEEEESSWQHRVLTVEEHTTYTAPDQAEEAPLPPALTVHHYHFTDWPDRGVPSSPSTLLHLLHHIHTTHPSLFTPSHNSLPTESPPPLLAHCSAGVGRTGTLLAVHRLLEQVKAGAKRVNILQTVRELRRWRPGMVQNLVQYKFIYSCVAHMLNTEPAVSSQHHTTPLPSHDSVQSSLTNSGASSHDKLASESLQG